MDAFLPSILDSTADILENPDLAVNSFSSDLDSSELSIMNNVDLCLECEEDGETISIQQSSDFYLSHEFIGENIQLAISFPNPSNENDFVDDSFPCSLCNSEFRKQNFLFKHLQESHNVRRSYTCDVCRHATTSSKLLSRHKIGKHGISKVKKSNGLFVNPERLTAKAASISAKSCENMSAEKCENYTNTNVDRIVKDDTIIYRNMSEGIQKITKNSVVEGSTVQNSHPDTGNISEIDTNRKSIVHGEMASNDTDSDVNTLLKDNSFQCTKCPYASKSKRLLKYHTDSMHNQDRKLFACVHCSYTCRQKRTLDIHTAKQHTGGDSYICDHCHKIFFSTAALKRHLAIHTQDKLFVCSLNSCHKAFKMAGALADHKRKVHSESMICNSNGSYRDCDSMKNKGKKVLCGFPGCGKSFRDKTNLRIHQCLHSGERPLTCSLCSFRCVQKTSLNYHNKKCHSV